MDHGLNLFVLWLLSCLQTNVHGDAEVTCVFMESCILPCSFLGGKDAIVHWYLKAGRTVVHSYYRNRDQLPRQDPRFSGRTSLFKDQISRGNASLQLTGSEVQDQGRYMCVTSTIGGNEESFINLNVDAPVGQVNIQREENHITCSSEGIYPEPQLSWSTSPPTNQTFSDTTQAQRTGQRLYNISSSLISPAPDLTYTCTVRTRRNWRRATLFKPTSISGSETAATIPCNAAHTSVTNFSLTWRFNRSQIILTQSGGGVPYTVSEGWRQQVGGVSGSGGLELQHLSSHHEGTYACELSDAEETLITTTLFRIQEEGSGVVAVAVITVVVILVSLGALGLLLWRLHSRRGMGRFGLRRV